MSGWRSKLGKFWVGIVLGVLVAELLVLVVAGEQPKFPRHVVRAPWGLRYNDPGSAYRHKSADMTTYFRINQQGMRSERDFAYAKPPGVKRILALGDSFTIGYEVDVDKTFTSILEDELQRSGFRVEVLNAGVSGFSNAEELLYLERELIRYTPDVVVVSFYLNDVEDNLRTNLFTWENGRLAAQRLDYVPGGALGNYLNTSWLFNFLSERSNLFALTKETLTVWIKRNDADKNIERLRRAQSQGSDGGEGAAAAPAENVPGMNLAAAIFERMYAFLAARHIPLVIQSIPAPNSATRKLVELFPLAQFDVRRPGIHFVSGKEFLEPSSDSELLYWTRSHAHWTPYSHALSGRTLAQVIQREKLLE